MRPGGSPSVSCPVIWAGPTSWPGGWRQVLGGTAVITTATDVQGLPALDVLAVAHGLGIENLAGVRLIHMALLAGRPVRLVDPEGFLSGELSAYPELFSLEPDLDRALAGPGPTVYVGFRERDWPPEWLRLRPRNLVAGMGCHKGTARGRIAGVHKTNLRAGKVVAPVPEGLGHH